MADTQAQAAAPLDPAPTNTFDDDDLIDYDDDVLEPTEGPEAKPVEAAAPVDDDEVIEATSPVAALEAPSMPTAAPAQEDLRENDYTNEQDEIDYDAEEHVGDDAGDLIAPTGRNESVKAAEEADAEQNRDQDDEEIDFGIGEDTPKTQPELPASVEGQSHGATPAEAEQENNTVAQEENGAQKYEETDMAAEVHSQAAARASGPVQVDAGPSQSDQLPGPTEAPQANVIEKDEITWEDAEDEVAPEDSSRPAEQLAAGNAFGEDATSEKRASQDYVTGEQVEVRDHTYDEPDNADEEEYPAITVQYKGEEFPLFSITSEGFFTSTSILHENIGALLSGFREELANEIASEDELVFQIDELGLEYAESHSQDILGDVTLNQILEIFDLLVKNQDPDSERALYTYLLTRPSTAKRFESLIESAAAGTGLDEVVFHFDSPVPQGTHPEGDQLTVEYHDLDKYQSPVNASPEAHDQDDNGHEQYGYIDGLEGSTDLNANASNIAHHEQSGTAELDGSDARGESLPAHTEGEPQAATMVHAEVDAAGNGNSTQSFCCQLPDSSNPPTTSNLTLANQCTRRAYNPSVISDFDMTFSHTDADETTPAFADTDFEMAMEADVEATAEDGDFDVNGDLTDAYQNGDFDLANAESSTSNTVANEDAEAGMTAEEAAEALDQYNEIKAPDQTEDEIDWRDGPGEEDASELSAGVAKRSHDTVELNEDDGPEPKRQRS